MKKVTCSKAFALEFYITILISFLTIQLFNLTLNGEKSFKNLSGLLVLKFRIN